MSERRCTILIADDEPLARQRLIRLLANLGFNEVIEAENGEEALYLFREHRPDIVMLDVRMPSMDGIDVAKAINQQNLHTGIIFTTAYDEYALPAFDVSAWGYLLKPINRQRLQDVLRLTLERLSAKSSADETPRIRCQFRGATVLVALSEISAFVAEDKYVTVHHSDGEALSSLSLKQLEADYPQDLLRVHRNTLVNKYHVKGLKKAGTKTKVLLHESMVTPEISRRWLPQVRRWLK